MSKKITIIIEVMHGSIVALYADDDIPSIVIVDHDEETVTKMQPAPTKSAPWQTMARYLAKEEH